jgi:hypothetical protein
MSLCTHHTKYNIETSKNPNPKHKVKNITKPHAKETSIKHKVKNITKPHAKETNIKHKINYKIKKHTIS